ncbi:MAG: hypothetical protein AUJ74_06215 [Candidatus Omnitrophica bacterium CG1_02_44_16]|nr:MAG: hypothetical protein AUJ74_06215 [Candidatus Omnitrophica bacterium CG1_02_44_16]PIY83035.1 MAG: hypothetical protein COY78_03605 [Candidatus Omnitrophica bacterium CG_4_10_14_0_8_um_filter_44_12]PIZ83362.1 MAG: hypothetical protein COX96_08025 [Candidatus Omnitrophica bacterium CG_4_10_14_0_2_um_filter_44_9]
MKCPLCDTQNSIKQFDTGNVHGRHVFDAQDHFELYRCAECGVFFLSNVIVNDTYYKKYYPKNYYNEAQELGWIKIPLEWLNRFSFQQKESSILKCLNNKENGKLRILDVGCGRGDFLGFLNKDIYETHGIEINPQGYAICQQKNIHVYNQGLKQIHFEDRSFDIITLWHVIEHLQAPKEMLTEIRRILKDTGVLVIATPNTASLGFKVGQSRWFHLDSPRHIILYNQNSMKKLLDEFGFNIACAVNSFFDYPLDLFWSLRILVWKILALPFYIPLKILSRETLMFVCTKMRP